MRSLSVAATGMMAQQLHVEVISNNIANMTTTGYKRRRAEFQDLLYQSQRRTGSPSSAEGTVVPAGVQLGLGVKTAAVYRIHDQGEFVNTENSLDLAIQGGGYFVVELPSGELAYTRSGNFQLSPDGELAFVTNIHDATVAAIATATRQAVATYAVGAGPNGITYAAE